MPQSGAGPTDISVRCECVYRSNAVLMCFYSSFSLPCRRACSGQGLDRVCFSPASCVDRLTALQETCADRMRGRPVLCADRAGGPQGHWNDRATTSPSPYVRSGRRTTILLVRSHSHFVRGHRTIPLMRTLTDSFSDLYIRQDVGPYGNNAGPQEMRSNVAN